MMRDVNVSKGGIDLSPLSDFYSYQISPFLSNKKLVNVCRIGSLISSIPKRASPTQKINLILLTKISNIIINLFLTPY